jgi:hypothetical protein
MVIVRKQLIIASILTACFYQLKAQQCSNCNLTPIVALYDLDVQVEQPELKGEATEGWLEWLELFWLARHANDYLYKNSKDCIRFMVGPDQDANPDGTQDIYKVGATHTHLPHPSIDRGYFTTGFVKKDGDVYTMHMELQSACDKKKIAESNLSFQIGTILKNVLGLAEQAATQLMPLVDKIRQYEINHRQENKNFTIAGHGRELIEIIPAKKISGSGQQTELDIRALDCDGTPLAGREISFTADREMQIPGTIGGTVTPATITTDNAGRAKAMFKMNLSADKQAIINAHSLTRTPENCSDAIIGTAKIDLAPAYKVTINYQKLANGTAVMKSSDSIFSITLADEKFLSSVYANTTLYHYTQSNDRNVHIDPENPSSKTVFIVLDGYSDLTRMVKTPEMEVVPLRAKHKEGLDSVQKVFSAEILYPQIQFSFNGDDLESFDFDFNFKEDRSGNSTVSGGILIQKGDKEATIEKKKITDGKSLFKTQHLIRYSRKTNSTNAYGQSTETEYAEIVILSSF